MGKISPVSSKYIIHSHIYIEGVVDKPDVIGAIFGQTEGLLGADLELRELQRSGRLGRIEVDTEIKAGKTEGTIIIPSSLDKAETSIIGAALETIQRIGPCNSRVKVEKIEDIRVSKRNFVISRAKELLKELSESVLPDSQEITEEVAYSVRMMEVIEYGRDRLASGPNIDDSDEIIVVEGRADVLNLLKHGIKNAISMNGTSVPQTIIDLSKEKIITAFVDGDRGGDLIIRELSENADIDFTIKAPDGKEVEELTKKEIHKSLRSKVAIEQVKMDMNGKEEHHYHKPSTVLRQNMRVNVSKDDRDNFKKMLDDLIGTRGAYILDEDSNILGKVPTSELEGTMRSLGSGVYAIVLDGMVTRDIASAAERSNVKHIIGMSSRVRNSDYKVNVITGSEL